MPSLVTARPFYKVSKYNALGSVEWWNVLYVADVMADSLACKRPLKQNDST